MLTLKNISLAIICMLAINAWSQQNVLLIISDDIGVDYSNGYNSPVETPSTPSIDSLASGGVLFENFWAYPFCSPTRSAVITGRHAFRTGVGAPVGGTNRPGLPLDEYTLPKAIKELSPHNYSTACIGKWHLCTNKNGKEQHPNTTGFDLYAGNTGGDVGDYFAWEKTVNGITETVFTYSTTENVNDAISYIDTVSKPWFMWLAFNAAHTPFHAPPDSLHSYNDLNPDPKMKDDVSDHFRAMIESMDTEIGRLLKHLKDSGIYDNTHIIYVGDNGTLKRVIQPPFNLDHSKSSLFNGGVHVPCIVKSSEITSKGIRVSQIAEVADIFSTVLELTGVTDTSLLPNIIDSKSLVPLLKNPGNSHKEWVFSQRFELDDKTDGVSIRNNDYHLMIVDSEPERLYELSSDTLESTNLLDGTLNTVEQENYDRLVFILDSIGVIDRPNSIQSQLLENDFDIHIEILNTGQLKLHSASTGTIQGIDLYDMSGKLHFSSKKINKELYINTNSNCQQAYILKYRTNDGWYTKKVVF
ncbi:MAG: sulfatase-like hydrolase/transferase [Bacteroidales bacterium]|nr:sulfatase-like hydrolase/transferase [Bacteroidales bacterium]